MYRYGPRLRHVGIGLRLPAPLSARGCGRLNPQIFRQGLYRGSAPLPRGNQFRIQGEAREGVKFRVRSLSGFQRQQGCLPCRSLTRLRSPIFSALPPAPILTLPEGLLAARQPRPVPPFCFRATQQPKYS